MNSTVYPCSNNNVIINSAILKDTCYHGCVQYFTQRFTHLIHLRYHKKIALPWFEKLNYCEKHFFVIIKCDFITNFSTCPSETNEIESKCYEFWKKPRRWAEAKSICASMGMTLLNSHTTFEEYWLMQAMTSQIDLEETGKGFCSFRSPRTCLFKWWFTVKFIYVT